MCPKFLPVKSVISQRLRIALLFVGLSLTYCVGAKGGVNGEDYFKQYSPSSEFKYAVDFHLWVPANIKAVRGVIVHQHGCGVGAEKGGSTAAYDLHWRALAKKWDCALLGTSYHVGDDHCTDWCDPRKGSEKVFLKALQDFAQSTGHEELAAAPWCLWGHSGGGTWASIMLTRHPQRVIAAWLRSGSALGGDLLGETIEPSENVYQIPIVCNPGQQEKDDKIFANAWTNCQATFLKFRAKNAPICFAADPQSSHECGDSRYAAIPFFDACLDLRLPPPGSVELRPLDRTADRLCNPECGNLGALAPFDDDKCSPLEASFLINLTFAKVWEGYVVNGAIADETPPPAPHDVQVVQKDGAPTLTWSADIDLESGLMGFIILRNGKTIKRMLGAADKTSYRPLLQGLTYHDTPTKPIVPFEWVIDTSGAVGSASYQVINVNSLGAPSEPSPAVSH